MGITVTLLFLMHHPTFTGIPTKSKRSVGRLFIVGNKRRRKRKRFDDVIH